MTTYSDLSAGQRDILIAVALAHGEQGEPTGPVVFDTIERVTNGSVTQSRGYQILQELADEDLVEISGLNRRTNIYEITEHGVNVLQDRKDTTATAIHFARQGVEL